VDLGCGLKKDVHTLAAQWSKGSQNNFDGNRFHSHPPTPKDFAPKNKEIEFHAGSLARTCHHRKREWTKFSALPLQEGNVPRTNAKQTLEQLCAITTAPCVHDCAVKFLDFEKISSLV